MNERRVSQGSVNTRKVIFCVHGKPSSGCCKVLQGEVIDVENQSDDITIHAKENVNTTNLSKWFLLLISRVESEGCCMT